MNTIIQKSGSRRAAFLAVLTSLGLALQGYCGLTWETREYKTKATPTEKEVTAKFPFTNTGDKPVKITAIRTNCGCTTASMTKKIFAPGEKGELVVHFDTDLRMGLHRKPIVVGTDDAKEPQVALYLVADIASIMELPKNFLMWREGDANEEQSLIVNTSAEYPVISMVAHTEDRSVNVTVEKLSATQFKVKVLPDAGVRNLVTILQMEAELATGQKKITTAYVSVR